MKIPDCKTYYEIHDADGFYIGLRAYTRRDAILEEWPSANIVSSDTSFNFTEYTLEYDGACFEVMVYGSLT